CGTTFLLNALSFFGVILFLYHWKRQRHERVETRRVFDAIRTGLSYVRSSTVVKSVLIRTGAFSLAASAIWALLPIIARPHGATGYGILVGSFGSGALAGAAVLPRLRRQLDRKSTRLNSSHLVISYAVFCLKKKKKNNNEHE